MADDQTVAIRAPLSGVIVPLERVPDPVFSQKMVGDGVSIDPTSNDLLAPCDGRIVQIHKANHAVTIETPEGVEVMMHVGIDTVALKGRGFQLRTDEGTEVKACLLYTSDAADESSRGWVGGGGGGW